MKITAVEFIVEQLDCLNRERKEKIIDAETYFKNKKALIEQAKELENRQKDDYAIEFAEWCIEWRVEFCDSTKEGILYTYGGMYQKYKMQELLEIFKKEKGL